MFVLFRHSSKTVTFNRFLKVAPPASSLINEVFNDGLLSELSISMLNKIIPLAWDYLHATSGKIYVKLKYEIFLQWNTKFSLQKVLGLLNFRSSSNYMNSVNVVKEIELKILNERAFTTGDTFTSEYVALLLPFLTGTFSIHWGVVRNF